MKREADIQKEVIDALRKMGKFALRLNSGKVKVRGGWMQLCPEGTPDIVVMEPIQLKYIVGSLVTWIEMKKPDGIHSDKQVEFSIEAHGRRERYFVCRSLDDVLQIWK